MNDVLIVGNNPKNVGTILKVVAQMGLRGDRAGTLSEGMAHLRQEDTAVVMVESSLPDGNGLSLLSNTGLTSPRPEIIVMTESGTADPEEAEKAIKNGAWDYLKGPLGPGDLKRVLSRALGYKQERVQREAVVRTQLDRGGIIGESAPLLRCLERVSDATRTDINVLILGETGTGKEIFADAIHRNSAKQHERLVVVDCASLPKTLVESTLFGYEKGAFTGAERAREGLVKQANNGTLFLDEIGELPLEVQKKFLRVLQEHTFRPVGSKQEQTSSFRLIAATNRNLVQMSAQGTFREDLLFRLKAMTISLPPLRERKDDLPLLVKHHMKRVCGRYDLPEKQFSEDFFDVLASYHWPGNVRELNQAVEYAMISAGPQETVFPQDLPVEVRIKVARNSIDDERKADGGDAEGIWDDIRLPSPLPTVRELREKALDELLKKYTRELIRQTGGQVDEARRVSGLSKSRIYALLKKYGPPRRLNSFFPEDSAI